MKEFSPWIAAAIGTISFLVTVLGRLWLGKAERQNDRLRELVDTTSAKNAAIRREVERLRAELEQASLFGGVEKCGGCGALARGRFCQNCGQRQEGS